MPACMHTLVHISCVCGSMYKCLLLCLDVFRCPFVSFVCIIHACMNAYRDAYSYTYSMCVRVCGNVCFPVWMCFDVHLFAPPGRLVSCIHKGIDDCIYTYLVYTKYVYENMYECTSLWLDVCMVLAYLGPSPIMFYVCKYVF